MMKAATLFKSKTYEDGAEVVVAALIGGEGIDLVVKKAGRRSVTVQLSVDNAMQLAGFISAAAQESKDL